ncbi:MAG TPA: phage major capsid protein, partial [Asticcacaulis sp.]|nr:phage major capsid protein [Asticcacaulis sp.]
DGGDPPGDTGKPPVKSTTNPERKAIRKGGLFDSAPKEGMKMKTISEQITAYKGSRDQKQARIDEILKAVADRGETPDAAESEELNTLEAEVDAIDTHVKRLEGQEQRNVKAATPVRGNSTEDGQQSRAAVSVQVKGVNLPKGTAFTRYAMLLAKSRGSLMQAAEMAKQFHDSTPEVETVLKAAVAAGTTTDSAWAKPLVEYQSMASEFAELLRPQTIIGRIPGLRRVPFNIKIPRQTAGSTAQWVGEGAPKPVSALAFDQITLGHTKLAGIVVLTDELIRFSDPAAEGIVRQDLIDTIVQTMDSDFVNPANAGTTDVKPASITNGVTPVLATGVDADHARADVKALMAMFLAANLSLAGAVWIMTEVQALGLAMMVNALGQREFPTIEINGVSGGTWFGLPVVLSENVTNNPGSGSPITGDGARIILAKASEILLADDGEVLLDTSREASLQMESAPTNPPVAATVMTSLWQMNMVGIRAERFINWAKRRTGAVQYIDRAKYGNAS